jgi:hypothetical protein
MNAKKKNKGDINSSRKESDLAVDQKPVKNVEAPSEHVASTLAPVVALKPAGTSDPIPVSGGRGFSRGGGIFRGRGSRGGRRGGRE